MKKRILIDGVIFGLQKAGGISRLFAEILHGLEERLSNNSEWEVFLLIPKNQNVEYEELYGSLKKIKVIKRRRFRWGKESFFRQSLYLTFLAWRYRPHLWHSSYYVGFPLYFCRHKIVTYHDMIAEIENIATPYESRLKYLSLKKSDKIFSVSHHSKKDLLEFWPEFANKTEVVTNCISLKEEGKSLPSPYFLFVGRRRGYKNFLFCVKQILEDVRFKEHCIYAVGGEEEVSSEELSLERVKWLKTRPFSEVKELMMHSAALLFPSLYEGFGFPVLEAFHYGVPVLAYNTSSIPEIAGEEYPLVDPNHPNDLTSVLERLINEREKWILYGKKRETLFSREKLIETLINHYEQHAL